MYLRACSVVTAAGLVLAPETLISLWELSLLLVRPLKEKLINIIIISNIFFLIPFIFQNQFLKFVGIYKSVR